MSLLAINTQLSGLIMWNSSKFTWSLLVNDIQPGPTIAAAPAAQDRQIAKENLFLHLTHLSLPPTHPSPPLPATWSFLLLLSPSIPTVRFNSKTATCFGYSSQLRPRPPTVVALSLPPVKHRRSRCWPRGMVIKLTCILSLNQGGREWPYMLKSDININVSYPITKAIHVQIDITMSQMSRLTVIADHLMDP